MASCCHARRGVSPAEPGVSKVWEYPRTAGATTTANGGLPIYLSEWLTHKLIKRYLETFSDETWPAVVKWTFVLGILALRNADFPSHCLSLEKLKDIAKQNSDELLIPALRNGFLQLLWRRDCCNAGKEDAGNIASLQGVETETRPVESGTGSVETASETLAQVGLAVGGGSSCKAVAVDDKGRRPAGGNCRVRGRDGERGGAYAYSRRAGIDEEHVVSRRICSCTPWPRKCGRQYLSAAESRRHSCCEPSAADKYQQRQHNLLLQKPSSSWRSGDPTTFAPVRGPYKVEPLPIPHRFSTRGGRTYPLWWGDCFISTVRESHPAVASAAAEERCGPLPAPAACVDAQRSKIKEQSPSAATLEQPPGVEVVRCPATADLSLSGSLQEQQQEQAPERQDCPFETSEREEPPLTLCLKDPSFDGQLLQQETVQEEEEMTTAATAVATPKFGAPSPAAGPRKAACSPRKARGENRVSSACHAGVTGARNGLGKKLLRSIPSSRSVASPQSPAAVRGELKKSEGQGQQESLVQIQHQCLHKHLERQRQIADGARQRQTQSRREFALPALQQQRRLRQRALHRSVAAPPTAVVDGFQSFRPSGEAQWICTLRPAAHRHMRPQPPVAAVSRRRQPILPPLGLPSCPATGRAFNGENRVFLGGCPAQKHQHCQQHQPFAMDHVMHCDTHHAHPDTLQSCRLQDSNTEGQKSDLFTVSELSAAAAPPDLLEAHTSARQHRNVHPWILSQTTGRAVEPAYCVGRLAAAVHAARAAAVDVAFCAPSAYTAATVDQPGKKYHDLSGNQQWGAKHIAHDTSLRRASNSSSNLCNYSSFFDAALAAYTNTTATDELPSSSLNTCIEPKHEKRSQYLCASLLPRGEPAAMTDHHHTIVARSEPRATGQQPVTGTDAVSSTFDRRCSTSESCFSLSSLSIAEQSAPRDLQITCAYPTKDALAEEQRQFHRQQLMQSHQQVKRELQVVDRLQFLPQREGNTAQELRMQRTQGGGKREGRTETHEPGMEYLPHGAARDSRRDSADEEEAVTVKELLQLYFPAGMESSAILKQRHSCAAPLPVDVGCKHKLRLQQSF